MFLLSWYPMSTLSSPSWRSRQEVADPRLSTPVLPTWQQSLSSIPQVCLSIWVPALVVPPALTDLRHSSTLWWFPCWIPWYTVWETKKSKMPWRGCKRREAVAKVIGWDFWQICFFLIILTLNNQRRQWHPTPVLLPGKFHGQRSLVCCSPWGP